MIDTDQHDSPSVTAKPLQLPRPVGLATAASKMTDPVIGDASQTPSATAPGGQARASENGAKPIQKHNIHDGMADTASMTATGPAYTQPAALAVQMTLPMAQDSVAATRMVGGSSQNGGQDHIAREAATVPLSHGAAVRQGADATAMGTPGANAAATGAQSAAASDPSAPSFSQFVAMPQTDASVAASLAASVSAGVSPTATASGQSLSTTQAGTAPAGATVVSDASLQLAEPLVTLASATDGSSRLQVSLHPKDLGEVNIKLDRDPDGSVRITVAASEPATLRSLIADQAHLHAALDAAAIPAADRQFSFELGSQNQGGGPDASPNSAGGGTAQDAMQQSGGGTERRSGQESRNGESGTWSAGAAQDEDVTTIPAFVAARTGSYRSAINITA